jgi:hypothetical protein
MAGTSVGVEDLVPVRSRISWGAVLAGAVIALAVNLLLTLFAGAIGLSLSDAGLRAGTWTALGVISAVVCIGAALFLGGWVTTQAAVGENKTEAVIHGVLMWGVFFAATLWMVGMGVRAGYNALVGAAYAAQVANPGVQNWEELAQRAGVPQADIDRARNAARPENIGAQTRDPQNQEAAKDRATAVAWWALGGMLLSIIAAVAGALVGAGPTFRLIRYPTGGVGVARVEERAGTPVIR